jgi:hypothetical protein
MRPNCERSIALRVNMKAGRTQAPYRRTNTSETDLDPRIDRLKPPASPRTPHPAGVAGGTRKRRAEAGARTLPELRRYHGRMPPGGSTNKADVLALLGTERKQCNPLVTLELAGGLRRRFDEQSVMFFKPRNVLS